MGIFEQGRHQLSRRIGLAALAFVAVLAALPAEQAVAQGAVKSVHKDWQIRCDTPPGAKTEQCALIQSVTAEDRANVGLTVIVLKTADAKSRLMRVSRRSACCCRRAWGSRSTTPMSAAPASCAAFPMAASPK